MSNSVIVVDQLSKKYRLGLKEKQSETLVGQLGQAIKSPWKKFQHLRFLNRFEEDDESVFWALRNISFEVKEGEVLGIIGKNGAGKSTLLKVLSQITEPTLGKIEIHGRIASLLEVGTGFHLELSGRENIYMNGTILGMTRKEIDSKLDEIINFSGIGKFIDTPVKFFSSGMKVRLGFAVAAYLNPEILIVDEVLAVGDYEFQSKCLRKMDSISRGGRTIIFVSHNLEAVKSLCSRIIVLNDGQIGFEGDVNEGVKFYLNSEDFYPNSVIDLKLCKDKKYSNLGLIEAKIYIDGLLSNEICAGQELKVILEYNVNEDHLNIPMEVGLGLFDQEGKGLLAFNNYNFKNNVELSKVNGDIEICIPNFPFYRSDKLFFSFYFGYLGDYYEILNKVAVLNCFQNDYLGSGKLLDEKLNSVYLPYIQFKVN